MTLDKNSIQELAVQFSTEGFDVDQQAVYDSWIKGASREEKTIFTEMVDTCAEVAMLTAPAVVVATNGKEKLISEVTSVNTQSPEEDVKLVRKGEQAWLNLPINGAKLLELSARKKDGFAVSIIDVAAGSEFPAHEHHGVEMAYILEGDLEADGVILHAGDFFRADAGTHHGTHFSPSGCQAIIMTANENYNHTAVRALSVIQRVRNKLKSAIGV